MIMRLRTISRIPSFSSYTASNKSCSSSNGLRFIHSFSNSESKKPTFFRHFQAATTVSRIPTSTTLRCFTTATYSPSNNPWNAPTGDDVYSKEEVEPIGLWDEEDDREAKIGDGGDGGGVVLNNCSWGGRALSIAQEVLQQFDEDLKLYAFKTTPRGYVYVRLDKLSNPYGCPDTDEIASFSRQYKKILEEVGATREIPEDLALEVSSPSADRILKIPEDLLRFQDMPMVVRYVETSETKSLQKCGFYLLDSIETESSSCVWKLADVKENRDPSVKGKLMNRKQRDWRLNLSFEMITRVTLCL